MEEGYVCIDVAFFYEYVTCEMGCCHGTRRKGLVSVHG